MCGVVVVTVQEDGEVCPERTMEPTQRCSEPVSTYGKGCARVAHLDAIMCTRRNKSSKNTSNFNLEIEHSVVPMQ